MFIYSCAIIFRKEPEFLKPGAFCETDFFERLNLKFPKGIFINCEENSLKGTWLVKFEVKISSLTLSITQYSEEAKKSILKLNYFYNPVIIDFSDDSFNKNCYLLPATI